VSRGARLPHASPTRGVTSSPRTVFPPESFYHLPHSWQSPPDAPSCGSCCRRAHRRRSGQRPILADGHGREKAIDLNILAGSRPLPSARDDRLLHLPRQKKPTKGGKKPPNPAPSFCSLSRGDQLGIYHQRARPTASLLTLLLLSPQKPAAQTRPSTACADPRVNHYSANSAARSFGY